LKKQLLTRVKNLNILLNKNTLCSKKRSKEHIITTNEMINNTIIMIEVKSLIMRKTIKLIIKIKEMINHTTHTKETKDLPMIEIKNLNMQ
jgi:hypothetical protein